jgi:WD40 repeat protein
VVRTCQLLATLWLLHHVHLMQVWDGAGESLLFVWQLPRSEVPSTQHTDFVRGLAFNMAADRSVQLCAGCSNSSIHVFSVAPGMHFKHATSLAHGAQPIAALASAFHSRRGGWADDLGSELVSCDDEGIIRVWQAQSSSSYADMGLRISITAGVPCCSVAVRRGFIVAGCTDGCVRIFSLVSLSEGWSPVGLLCNLVCQARIKPCLNPDRRTASCATRLSRTAGGCRRWTSTPAGT